ncbi:MAG: EamA family transporter [Nitrososphaeraceae archaeon]
MLRKSWIVFLFALILSIESILIEYFTNALLISPLAISAFSIPISGLLLLSIESTIFKHRISIFSKSWKYLLGASTFLALGIFGWYDAVSKIGASKEALLSGPIETIVILFLARIFLKEKLNNIQFLGVAIAIIGFFMIVLSGSSSYGNFDYVLYNFGIFNLSLGDTEAILSGISFAIGVIFLTKLVAFHSPIEVAGSSLLLAGFLLLILMVFTSNLSFSLLYTYWYIFLLFSLLTFFGIICYTIGLKNIGASLTSTISSSRNLLTLILQLLLLQFGIIVNIPNNLFLAIFGGILGLIGIYIIHMHNTLSFSKWRLRY